MFRVAVALFFASVLLTALALISCFSIEDRSRIRHLPRYLWVLLIVLVPLVGAGAWFLAGRPAPEGGHGPGWPIGGGFPQRPRPKAPDDDPDFLRSLDEPSAISDEDERLLRQWEEDLRRREEDQRRGDADPEG